MENFCNSLTASDLTPEAVARFRQIIYRHFCEHGRTLPWRTTDDPYRILVSEIMLQQTQVERVLPLYDRFLTAFPDFTSLAYAPLREILAVWQGLGYNRRALALQHTARRVVTEFAGKLPDSPEALRTLPGIGAATAGALMAFVYHKPAVFLETNIRRVFLHFFFPTETGVKDRELLPLVEKTLDQAHPRPWYYALMDYGAMLKKGAPNPNRRSAHYQKQSPFENSDRQIRGRILRILLRDSPLPREQVEKDGGEGPERVQRIVSHLVAEGFLDQRGNLVSISSGAAQDDGKVAP